MSGVLAIYRRELAGMFLAPLAWILLCLTLVYNGFFFSSFLAASGGEVNQSLMFVLGQSLSSWFLMAVLPPLITMRMISEESRSGMLEFLLTAPVSDAAVIAGKALAATTFMALVWSCVPLYALVVQLLGAQPDWGVVLVGTLGAVLVSALFTGIGLVASALSSTPVLAAFLAMLVNLVLVFLPTMLHRADVAARGPLHWLLARIDVMANFQGSFLSGALDSAHVVFFLAWTLGLLFLAVRLVESRRWL